MVPKGQTFEEKIISRVMTKEKFRRQTIHYVMERLLYKKNSQDTTKEATRPSQAPSSATAMP